MRTIDGGHHLVESKAKRRFFCFGCEVLNLLGGRGAAISAAREGGEGDIAVRCNMRSTAFDIVPLRHDCSNGEIGDAAMDCKIPSWDESGKLFWACSRLLPDLTSTTGPQKHKLYEIPPTTHTSFLPSAHPLVKTK